MKTNKIIFKNNQVWLSKESPSAPTPIINHIPEWYRKSDRFAKIPGTNKFFIGPDKGKIPTWKACPALFDIMSSGYSLNTPCDIEFYDNNGVIDVKVLSLKYSSFIQKRSKMSDFVYPIGYQEESFAWFGNWQIKLPKGYSALYSSPFNRYDLPFLTTSGIIDNDKVHMPGSYPFFIKNGYTGVIPAGTPYMQLIPFKRENWISEFIDEKNQEKLLDEFKNNSNFYRQADGGVYKNKIWEKREYK